VGALYGILGHADPSELRLLGDRLAHRGREAAEWSPGRDLLLGIRGPRRLVDLQEHGPVAFEGAIDNRDEIARLLRRRAGDAVGPWSDAWLVFELVDALGPEALQRLAGPFAVACWHGSERRLLLARDRAGHAPLYFTAAGGRFAFASEYKALLALHGVTPAPDLDALQSLQVTGWMPAGRTGVLGVFPVAPGSYLEVRIGRLSSQRYWQPRSTLPAAAGIEVPLPRSEWLAGALGRQVAGYGRIGIAVHAAGEMAPLARAVRAVAGGREIHTVAAGRGADDQVLLEAARMARAFGARHHAVVLEPDDLQTLLPWMIWHLEEPGGGEEIAYLFTAVREAARHVSVLVSGFGLESSLAGGTGRRLADLERKYPILGRSLSGGRALGAAYRRWRDSPAPRVLGAASPPAADPPRWTNPAPPHECAVERLYSAVGLRLGSPGTDPAFLDAVLSSSGPWRFVRWRRGGVPFADRRSVSNALDRLAVELLSPGAVRERGLFEPSYVVSLLRRPQGQPYGEGQSRRIWSLLLTELWARAFLDGRGAAPAHPMPPLRALHPDSAGPAPATSGAR
jgi:asparagine synthase (glutamine-hydrolysing)